ncbi:LolA family protein [Entomospira culicis]|uniref:Outer membrane lipoprotein carrier protein LolA n=1 Tax=Entomospira culicis TaxID=2719989 RepID=A0A968KUT9_9SPIO|nr:outer membrane lipoprotein carrier protein LolA [Entomospira culicis]NIZ19625.1 outer membrane lipoprotein carrier protein LolA [Entomospira culicis]NIZ69470.1 outer membrane lipoprotein carrier protein LolA [Entomospira culicis]WDI36585.1 outer membrane lipoprotein carrier protein LolA [Entomospira culicis]WDI38213.1 outer membrane lipoprotein carrier protein LolA [Entomospira culicis]
MHKIYLILLTLFLAGSLGAQESADAFFQRVSDRYAKIEDYDAAVRIQRGERIEFGRLRYKSPNLLRLDYTAPSGQILVVSENKVELYLPRSGVVMEQVLPAQSDAEVMGLSGNGLRLLRENYFISFSNNGQPEPLESGSAERVVKLSLKWRVNAEGFRSLEISVNPETLLIRRITGITSLFENIRYDFTNITINRGMNSSIFVFTPEEGQSVVRYPNFLNLQDN